jgi:hypothetical protein
MEDRVERVRSRASEIWEREGRPEGRALDHWLEAETQILSEDSTGGDKSGESSATDRTSGSNGNKPRAKKSSATIAEEHIETPAAAKGKEIFPSGVPKEKQRHPRK